MYQAELVVGLFALYFLGICTNSLYEFLQKLPKEFLVNLLELIQKILLYVL